MKKKSLIYEITTCAIFSALMCIFGPMSVPIGPIPISLTNLVIYLAIYILGSRGTTISFLIYLLLGAVGLPVFSGYSGGVGKLVGPTGGYLVGFIFVAYIGGVFMEKSRANVIVTTIGLVLSTLLLYALGTAWFVYQAGADWTYALGVCVYPFIPFDIGKMVIATILGKAVRVALIKAKLLPGKNKVSKADTQENNTENEGNN